MMGLNKLEQDLKRDLQGVASVVVNSFRTQF